MSKGTDKNNYGLKKQYRWTSFYPMEPKIRNKCSEFAFADKMTANNEVQLYCLKNDYQIVQFLEDGFEDEDDGGRNEAADDEVEDDDQIFPDHDLKTGSRLKMKFSHL